MEDETIVTAFSHENKIHGLTTSGHLAEWDAKGLRWVVRGKTNEVFDHATAAKLRVPDAPAFMPSGRHGRPIDTSLTKKEKHDWEVFFWWGLGSAASLAIILYAIMIN